MFRTLFMPGHIRQLKDQFVFDQRNEIETGTSKYALRAVVGAIIGIELTFRYFKLHPGINTHRPGNRTEATLTHKVWTRRSLNMQEHLPLTIYRTGHTPIDLRPGILFRQTIKQTRKIGQRRLPLEQSPTARKIENIKHHDTRTYEGLK